jgi:hypothetical protein
MSAASGRDTGSGSGGPTRCAVERFARVGRYDIAARLAAALIDASATVLRVIGDAEASGFGRRARPISEWREAPTLQTPG